MFQYLLLHGKSEKIFRTKVVDSTDLNMNSENDVPVQIDVWYYHPKCELVRSIM